ncbi:hypothetical protein IEQ34_008973 [Dendrobium chrysotoxum]|uniref:Uncharacterized protein n=1 Tax=Dendrobium chrysotoxum TaxID=161865 RepID=A0AAV7H0B5_DENCH|nr:hypothetical protein IEQ34_008973 [Dendrobium chrysotoxum]
MHWARVTWRVRIRLRTNPDIGQSILLGSYLGVVAKDPILAPISFSDWRNKGLEPFKKRMLAEVEAKFEFPTNIKHWILQSLGVKWCNFKTSLKAEHWDSRPVEEIMEAVPAGVDSVQWYQLISKWSQPQDKSVQDRLLLWKINRTRKDGSWSSEEARQKWAHASEMLAEEGLMPEDGNFEANEKVFKAIMGSEHPGRVRTQGFGVIPSRYFPHSTTTPCISSGGNTAFDRVVKLEEVVRILQNEVRQLKENSKGQHPPPGSSTMVLDHNQAMIENVSAKTSAETIDSSTIPLINNFLMVAFRIIWNRLLRLRFAFNTAIIGVPSRLGLSLTKIDIGD